MKENFQYKTKNLESLFSWKYFLLFFSLEVFCFQLTNINNTEMLLHVAIEVYIYISHVSYINVNYKH
jgi:hypothetical protein